MADHVRKFDNRHAGLELLDDEGVAEIVNFSPFDTGNAEVAVDGCANVSDQERIASLGDKEGGIFGFGATRDIFFDRCFGC